MDNSDLQLALYYLDQAAECEMLAAMIGDPRSREILLSLAARWRGFAIDPHARRLLEKSLRPKSIYPSGGW